VGSIVFNSDCVEGMKQFPDKHFDLCLTDFPYGVNANYTDFDDTVENTIELINLAMPEILRVSKRAAITTGVKLMYHYPKPDWVGCIYSSAGIGVGSHGFCCWQPLLIYGKDPKLQLGLGSMPDSFTYNEGNDKESKFHPVPKPLKFWKKVLDRWTNKNDKLILDPFLGSGTTRIACADLGFDFTGFELSKEYFDKQEQRYRDFISQTTLF
jgi:site-specific DNA-methyltransferase (adenine-specific)